MIAKSIYPLVVKGKTVKNNLEEVAVSNGWNPEDVYKGINIMIPKWRIKHAKKT